MVETWPHVQMCVRTMRGSRVYLIDEVLHYLQRRCISQPAWCDNKCELNNVLLLMLSGKVNLLWVAGPVVYRWLLR